MSQTPKPVEAGHAEQWQIGTGMLPDGSVLNPGMVSVVRDDGLCENICQVLGVPIGGTLGGISDRPEYAVGVRRLHLISAAPDLAEACKAAYDAIARVGIKLEPTAPEWQEPLMSAYQGLRAALTKAGCV